MKMSNKNGSSKTKIHIQLKCRKLVKFKWNDDWHVIDEHQSSK